MTRGDLVELSARSQLRRSTMRQLSVTIKYAWEGQNRRNMNFRPTILKVVISLVIGYLSKMFFIETVIARSPSPTAYIYNLYGVALVIVVVYVLWSLFQKRQNS